MSPALIPQEAIRLPEHRVQGSEGSKEGELEIGVGIGDRKEAQPIRNQPDSASPSPALIRALSDGVLLTRHPNPELPIQACSSSQAFPGTVSLHAPNIHLRWSEPSERRFKEEKSHQEKRKEAKGLVVAL